MVTPVGRREAAGHLQAAYEMSERRACRVLGVDRTSVRYQAPRPDDGALRDRLKALVSAGAVATSRKIIQKDKIAALHKVLAQFLPDIEMILCALIILKIQPNSL